VSNLRKNLIRLAHENPELRPKLLPLLAANTSEPMKKVQKVLKERMSELSALHRQDLALQRDWNDTYNVIGMALKEMGLPANHPLYNTYQDARWAFSDVGSAIEKSAELIQDCQDISRRGI